MIESNEILFKVLECGWFLIAALNLYIYCSPMEGFLVYFHKAYFKNSFFWINSLYLCIALNLIFMALGYWNNSYCYAVVVAEILVAVKHGSKLYPVYRYIQRMNSRISQALYLNFELDGLYLKTEKSQEMSFTYWKNGTKSEDLRTIAISLPKEFTPTVEEAILDDLDEFGNLRFSRFIEEAKILN